MFCGMPFAPVRLALIGMLQTMERIKPNLRTVLVVDDQADVREALRLMLKSAGYSIQMAESPDDAVATAVACNPDLILIDMNYTYDTTSGQEGLALLDRLGKLRRSVPIIAMTGWSTIELAVQAMQHGACDFITKPWDVNHLLETFEKHLSKDPDSSVDSSSRSADLALARRIQQRLLPPPRFAAAGLDFDCAFLPFGEVGGDLYDFFEIDSTRAAFLLGDVCGKGLGAALLVATLQATIRSQLDLANQPAQLLSRVNQQFFRATRPEHFATLFFGVYDSASRNLRYVNCGHPSGVLLRDGAELQLLEPSAVVLGAFEKTDFQEQNVSFQPGNRLILFSDGLSEAGVADNEEDDWALDAIRRLNRKRTDTFSGSLAAAALARSTQADDITVIQVCHQACT
jgi:sigma-B regulation protein RsbU (phosphoserine phosphatase)